MNVSSRSRQLRSKKDQDKPRMYLIGLNNYRVIRIRINQECNSRSRPLRSKKDQDKPRI